VERFRDGRVVWGVRSAERIGVRIPLPGGKSFLVATYVRASTEEN
jgi:hypothetical protein